MRKITIVFEVDDRVTNDALHEALCLCTQEGTEFDVEGCEDITDPVIDIQVMSHEDGLPNPE